MPNLPLRPAPGICKALTDYAGGKAMEGAGRYTDGDHVRFVAGFPEKIGGWVSYFSGMTGIPRVMKQWRDTSSTVRLAIGTESHIYSWNGISLTDHTPLRTVSTGTLGANPITTVIASNVVTIADTNQHIHSGDWVKLTGATAVNGITLNGWYRTTNRTATTYDLYADTAASGNGSGGGAAVAYSYPRVLLGANPFSTTSGSATVTVTHVAHGCTTGDYAILSNASAVAGLTIDGEYQVTVTDADHFTITASGNASSTTTGGGASVDVGYLVHINTVATGGVSPFIYDPAGWTLDNYGYQLLACPYGGTIYVYNPTRAGRMYPLLNAPDQIRAMFVTAERFVVALGTSSSAMTMAWADQTDYTVWTSTPTNTALSGRTKQGGTSFMAGGRVRDGVSLALSNLAPFIMNYTGDSSVYSTLEASDNAGCVGPRAFVVFGETAFWMSAHEFWVWDGTIHVLPSDDIREHVFSRLTRAYMTKCWAGSIKKKRTIIFAYPADGATEITDYVEFHMDQSVWSIGKWSTLTNTGVRTAWTDAELFPYPMAADVNGVVYQHENGTNDNGSALAASLTFAPVDITNGDVGMNILGFLPDVKRQTGNVSLTVNVRSYPEDSDTAIGPYTLAADGSTSRIDFRTDGNMVGFVMTSNAVGGDFRLGLPRVVVQPAGTRT